MPLSAVAATWPLLLGMGVLMLGAGLQSTLLALRATLEGFTPPVTGIIMSCYYAGYLLGTMIAPPLLRRVGHIRVFAAMAAVASAAILLQGCFVDPLVWGAMRMLSGLCMAGIYVVAESWLNNHATSGNRGRLFAIYMLVLYVGLGAAQFLLGLASPTSAAPFMLVSMLISLALVPIVLSAQQLPGQSSPGKVRLLDLYRNSPLGVAGVMISGLISATIFSMGPVYARLSGQSTQGVATFMGVSILAAVLTQYPVGRLSDRMDRRTVIAGICAVSTLFAAGIVLFKGISPAIYLTLAGLFSGFALTLYSLSVSHVNDKLESHQMVAATSALLLLNGTAAVIGPILSGTLMARFGPQAYFATLAALTAALLVYDLWRKWRSRPVPPAQKTPFIGTQPRA